MYIYSMGHYWPENIIDNKLFDTLDIGSEGEWIWDRVGIKERRSVMTPDMIRDVRFGRKTREQLKESGAIMTIAAMSEKAWSVARSRFAVVVDRIDTVIGGTSVPDDDIPASGCAVAAQIGIERVRAFDVNSACSTFVVQNHVMKALCTSGMTQEGVIFCTERYTTRVDYTDRKNCILFGDASVAALISSTPKPGSLKVIDTMVESAPSGFEHIRMPHEKPFHQNGAAVQKFAVTKTIAAAQDILTRNSLTAKDAQWFIGHQANYRMLTSAMEKLGVDQKCHLYNVIDRGNQGGAGAPSVLSQNWDLYKPGDYIVIAVVGAGLTWGSMLLQKQ
jgi:3-oxoacyl-[acyl-carrier-protein] synthase-3